MEGKIDNKGSVDRTDVCSLEADAAFFDARLSLAGNEPDTVYQRAQIKTYEVLGKTISNTIETLRRKSKA